MYPPLFGHLLWDTSLVIAANYPVKATEYAQKMFENFIQGIVFLTPCPTCAQSALAYVKEHPPANISSRQEAVKYVVDFHNFVNRKLGKAEMTVKEALESLVERFKKDFAELPRAMQIRQEDAKRIETLNQRLTQFESGSPVINNPNSTDSIFIYVTVAFSILTIILIIILVVVLRKNYHLRAQRNKI